MTQRQLQINVEPDATARRLRQYVRKHPDVRHEDYRDADDPVEEACYVLAEAYFHASGGPDGPFDVHRLDWAEVNDDWAGAHWFLRDGDTIVDLSLPTPDAGSEIPWAQARHRAFITGYTPSNRTERVLTDLGIDYDT